MGINWGDTFYPGNPERRDKVTALATRVYTVMEQNFSATNDLIDLLNENVTMTKKLQHISVDHGKSIKTNSDRFIARMDEIKAIVATVDADLAKRLDPDIYRDLKSPDLDFSKKVQKAEKIFNATLSVIATIAGIALCFAISGGALLPGMVAIMGVAGTSAVAGIVLGTFMLGIGMIYGAISGAIERDKLEEQIDDLEDLLESFEPASKKYQKDIIYVQIVLEEHFY